MAGEPESSACHTQRCRPYRRQHSFASCSSRRASLGTMMLAQIRSRRYFVHSFDSIEALMHQSQRLHGHTHGVGIKPRGVCGRPATDEVPTRYYPTLIVVEYYADVPPGLPDVSCFNKFGPIRKLCIVSDTPLYDYGREAVRSWCLYRDGHALFGDNILGFDFSGPFQSTDRADAATNLIPFHI